MRVVRFFVLLGLTAACSAAPDLPTADTMSFSAFSRGPQPNNTGGGATMNADGATAAVGLVSVAVQAVLLTPRLIWLATVSETPSHANGTWTWKKTMPFIGLETVLTATTEGDTVKTEMHVTGLRGDEQLENFLWYSGSHSAGSGNWTFFSPEHGGSQALTVEWTRDDETHKRLVFTNVLEGNDGHNDTVTYSHQGDLMSMDVHDQHNSDGNSAEFSVVWNAASGAGRIDRVNGESACWDTIANGQFDMDTCPDPWP